MREKRGHWSFLVDKVTDYVSCISNRAMLFPSDQFLCVSAAQFCGQTETQ